MSEANPETEEDFEYLRLRKLDSTFGPTYVQRVLRIGYQRAKRVLDLGVEKGHFEKENEYQYKLVNR